MVEQIYGEREEIAIIYTFSDYLAIEIDIYFLDKHMKCMKKHFREREVIIGSRKSNFQF